MTISTPVAVQVRGSLSETDLAQVAFTPLPRMRRTWVRWPAHSGHRMPTDVGVMQSGQIGRPQLEHETPVSREGCL
ncbi:MAG: hypothetical protein ACP5H2_00570 [Solirubrobacteraceae bacterium]